MMSTVVSREEELASLHAFIDAPAGGPVAFVLEGEAGIGKSTLWLAGVDLARERELRVLSSRPAEAERSLAHVGLGDLLDDVLDDVLPVLSAPRRRALEVALLREDAAGDRIDPRALGLAIRSGLEALSEHTPALVAIDDVQWFDPSSTARLRSRCAGWPVPSVRATARPPRQRRARHVDARGRTRPEPTFSGCRWGRSASARFTRCCATAWVGHFARQTLLRIQETSGGNPFFALELARVVDGGRRPVQPLVPETLEELVRARISGLPARRLRRWHSPQRWDAPRRIS